MLDPTEKLVFQLSETLRMSDKNPLPFESTVKRHTTMLEKKIIPLYLEHLSFLIKRPGWRVTKVYSHYTFEQERFKSDYIIMNKNKIKC